MRTPPLLKIRGYNIKTLITVESLHFVVFPNVLRTCSVRASYVLRTCSVRAASHGWCWGQIAQICRKILGKAVLGADCLRILPVCIK